jgi:site-specific recombinase XerD
LPDIYNRKQKLERWISKVNSEVVEPDKTDILKCIQHMQDNERSALWIINFITNLVSLRKKLNKPFRKCSKDDIRRLIYEINKQNFRVKTIEKYRSILKQFFKIVYGENEYFPDTVKWIKTNPGKDKRSLEKKLDMAKFFDQDDIIKLIENAPTIQNKASSLVYTKQVQDQKNF